MRDDHEMVRCIDCIHYREEGCFDDCDFDELCYIDSPEEFMDKKDRYYFTPKIEERE